MIEELREVFEKNGNKAIAAKQSAYMRNLFPFYGIPKPQRGLLEKEIFRQFPVKREEELVELIERMWKEEMREFQYAALSLAKKHGKLWSPSTLILFERMVREKSWWDTVDDIAANLVGPLLRKEKGLVAKMDEWIDDDYLWIRRTALIFQLRWKEKTDEGRLFSYCTKRMSEREFFIRKAIGWALRQHGKHAPDKVRAFVEEHRGALSGLSIREAEKYLLACI